MSFVTSKKEFYSKLNQVPYKINTLNSTLKRVKGWGINSEWHSCVSIQKIKETKLTFIRNFMVNVDLGLNWSKDMYRPLNGCIGVGILKVGNAGQVIGDIRFYDKVLNETDYDATITPFGYGKWRQMVTGDYIYGRALCKYSMQASLNADRPNTREYRHKVDVPDVVDRGVATLTKSNQPLFIEFSDEDVRKFHIVPELTVSIKSYSGTGVTPLVIPYNTTTEGFYVTMKDGEAFVEGSISWSARGY